MIKRSLDKNKLEKILGRVCMSIIFVILLFIAADYISISILPSRYSVVEEKYPYRKPSPYVMFGGLEHGELKNRRLLLDAEGGNKKMPPQVKKLGEYRIFVLGGSVILGGNPKIPKLLEQKFRANGFQNVYVYNFGVTSSGSSQDLARIVFEISYLQPDLIVMYNGGNDLIHAYNADPRPGYPFNFIAYENNPLFETDVRSYSAFAMLAYGSNILRYYFPEYFVEKFLSLEKIKEEVRWGSEEWKDDIAEVYAHNLSIANKISGALGAEFIAFFQPLVYFKDRLSSEEEQYTNPALQKNYSEMRKKILAKAGIYQAKSSLKFVDLSDLYDDIDRQVFRDDIHTTQESKHRVADKMYNNIIKNFEIPKLTSSQ